jgi:hypothetical protein
MNQQFISTKKKQTINMIKENLLDINHIKPQTLEELYIVTEKPHLNLLANRDVRGTNINTY